MPLGLILPRSIEERRKVLVCTVPGCGKRFPMDQDSQWARHVKACSTRNEDRMLAIVEHRDNNYFTASADPELSLTSARAGTEEAVLKRNFAEVVYQENAQDGFVPGDEAAHRAAAALADRADAPTIGVLTDMLAFLERVGGQFHVTALRLEANPDEWETHGFGLMVETRDARLKVAEAPEDVRGVPITDMQGPPAEIEPLEEQSASDPDPAPEADEPAPTE